MIVLDVVKTEKIPYSLAWASRINPENIVFYIGRHGRTEFNQDNLFRGAANPKLDAVGKKDAEQQAEFFDSRKIGRILSSTKLRAAETSEIVGKRKHIEPELFSNLDSWNIGMVSGLPEESKAEELIQYYVAHPGETIPEGESLNHFKERVHPFFFDSIKRHNDTGIPDLISAHHSVIREAASLFNHDPESALVDPGGVVAVVDIGGRYRVIPVFKPEVGDDSE